MKIHFLGLLLLLCLFFSCSPLLNINKLQSDNGFKRTENRNFSGDKAKTQWWYFDCILEDGSVIVFLFNPHQWWSKSEKITTDKSLFYFSYMNADGEVKTAQKTFDFKELVYDKDGLKCPYFELTKTHNKGNRKYNISFNLEEIKGTATVSSISKGFSPLPTGSMGIFATKHILKLKGEDLAFRYASHVPQGKIDFKLQIEGKSLVVSGKAYHEQGWFTGETNQMGKGWNWYHFVSKSINVFGKPGDFVCLDKDGKRIMAGFKHNDYLLKDKMYGDGESKFLIGGNISFASNLGAFEITSNDKTGTPLIYIPSYEGGQLWGNAVQKSTICLTIDGIQIEESGLLLLETCSMAKDTTIHSIQALVQ